MALEERVSRLEGGYEHLATKADLAQGLKELEQRVNGRIDRVFWAIIGIGGGLLAAAATALIRDSF